MLAEPRPPKAFLSYSWDSDSHRDWARRFASRLRADGVVVTLDYWHVQPGDQLAKFMESAVRDNDFVLIVCTPRYRARSNDRCGGVGYEGNIITAEVLNTGEHLSRPASDPARGQGDAAPSWSTTPVHCKGSPPGSDGGSGLDGAASGRTTL